MTKPPLTILSSKKPTLRTQEQHDAMIAEAVAAAMSSITPEDIEAARARGEDFRRIGEQLGIPPVSDPQAVADYVIRAGAKRRGESVPVDAAGKTVAVGQFGKPLDANVTADATAAFVLNAGKKRRGEIT